MFFAIIEASSDVSRLATVAYGDTVGELAEWFAEEFRENYEMYRLDDETDEDKKVLTQCDELCELARNEALSPSDLYGLAFGIADIAVEVCGVYDDYDSFREGLEAYVATKPKFKKISLPSYPDDEAKACDEVNALLVRASL